jgi:osmoprotectant transport system permease protein
MATREASIVMQGSRIRGRQAWPARLMHALRAVLLVGAAAWAGAAGAAGERLVVGSKRFTESYILGELVAQAARPHAPATEHRQGLGNTAVVLEALKAGAIDVYPEYLGTIAAEILKLPPAAAADIPALNHALAPLGLGLAVPLGFQNGYALAMRGTQASQLGVNTLTDLAKQPALQLGLSHEFIGRADGWPGLAARYRLPQRPTGIDHGIAYEALAAGRIEVMDIYTTDARIAQLGLRVLADDAAYFPRYDAVLLYRLDLPARQPAAWRAIGALQGRLDEATMIRLNGDAELRGRAFADIARDFLRQPAGAASLRASSASFSASSPASTPAGTAGFSARLFGDDLARLTRQHLLLVLVAVGAACVVGLPLGALAAALPRLEQLVMALVGLLQTVPSLALFAMLIPLLGRIGTLPALVALALYALLPIVRNTCTGLTQVPPGLRDAGTALGFSRWQRFRLVDWPLALPVILAGVKTAAVITVGTATIAAFIGAGGYGERIATGLALNDHATLLAGALPAAALALLTQGLFELLSRLLAPRRTR